MFRALIVSGLWSFIGQLVGLEGGDNYWLLAVGYWLTGKYLVRE